MSESSTESLEYEAPALARIGTLHELTLVCDKRLGEADGYTFMGDPIVCTSI
jgi:hypothetical protein